MSGISNSHTFIPIISIPGLMAPYDPTDYKEYSLEGGDYTIPARGKFGIVDTRPLVDVFIRPKNSECQKLKEGGLEIPKKMLRAMVDTGAKRSVIKKSVIDELEIETRMKGTFTGLGVHEQEAKNADLSIHIFNVMPGDKFLDIFTLVHEINEQDFDFIIGWDVLRYCHLDYNGPASIFTLEFKEKH